LTTLASARRVAAKDGGPQKIFRKNFYAGHSCPARYAQGDDSAPLDHPHVVVTLPLRDIPAADTDDLVTLANSGETLKLGYRIAQDEAFSQWVVSNG